MAPAFRLWLDGGVVGDVGMGGAPVEGGYGLSGGLGVSLADEPARGVGILLQVREIVTNLDDRHVSSIGILGRYPADDGPFFALGAAHHHELPWSSYLDDPLAGALATHTGITHRTGFELGGGWDFAPGAPESKDSRRFRPSLQLTGVFLPATEGPLAYVLFRAPMRLGLKEYE